MPNCARRRRTTTERGTRSIIRLPRAGPEPLNARNSQPGCTMIQYIVRYGSLAGLIVGIPMIAYMLSLPADAESPPSMLATYVIMLVALSMVFVGIRQYRDKALGGVIKFAPALGLGLAISGVAGIFYAAAWEVSQAFMSFDFADFYAKSMVEN